MAKPGWQPLVGYWVLWRHQRAAFCRWYCSVSASVVPGLTNLPLCRPTSQSSLHSRCCVWCSDENYQYHDFACSADAVSLRIVCCGENHYLVSPGYELSELSLLIEQSISVVDGVRSADAELETRTCSVTFDDAVATVEDISGATAGISYPSTIIK